MVKDEFVANHSKVGKKIFLSNLSGLLISAFVFYLFFISVNNRDLFWLFGIVAIIIISTYLGYSLRDLKVARSVSYSTAIFLIVAYNIFYNHTSSFGNLLIFIILFAAGGSIIAQISENILSAFFGYKVKSYSHVSFCIPVKFEEFLSYKDKSIIANLKNEIFDRGGIKEESKNKDGIIFKITSLFGTYMFANKRDPSNTEVSIFSYNKEYDQIYKSKDCDVAVNVLAEEVQSIYGGTKCAPKFDKVSEEIFLRKFEPRNFKRIHDFFKYKKIIAASVGCLIILIKFQGEIVSYFDEHPWSITIIAIAITYIIAPFIRERLSKIKS